MRTPKGELSGQYQYGVMYDDGSVGRWWNGNTQEKRAYESVADYYNTYPGSTDKVRVVRRWIGPWEEVDG